MRAGETTSLPKMVSTRSADIEPRAEPFEEVVTGGETSRTKGCGRTPGVPGLGVVKPCKIIGRRVPCPSPDAVFFFPDSRQERIVENVSCESGR